MKLKKVLLLLYLISSFGALFAQEDLSFDLEIDSKVFGTKRWIKVALPENYNFDQTQKYGVTYLLDAQSEVFWNMAKANLAYLTRQLEVIPTILVGIVSENRGTEFSPRSNKLNEHLQKEVFPLIATTYRTENFRILVGHSWAGAFIGNTLFSDYQDQFNAYLGISPSLGAIDGLIFEQAEARLALQKPVNKYFYCSSGDLGIMEYESSEEIGIMDSIIRKHPQSNLIWKREQFPNTDHWSCVIPSLNNGMLAISRNYFPDEKVIRDFLANEGQGINAQIDNFYAEKLSLYGYVYRPNEKYWESIADNFRQLEEFDAAKELYLRSIKMGNDQSVLLHFKLLQTYVEMGDQPNTMLLLDKTDQLLAAQKRTLKKSLYDSLCRQTKAIREKQKK